MIMLSSVCSNYQIRISIHKRIANVFCNRIEVSWSHTRWETRVFILFFIQDRMASRETEGVVVLFS